MMLIRCVVGLSLALSLAACGSGEGAVMPDLTSERLDTALSDLERAGYDDEPEVLGGGTFGIVDESNWTVCDQEPDAGETVGGTPRLTVDRSCDDIDDVKGEQETDNAAPRRQAPKDREPPPRNERGRGTKQAETFVMPALVGANLQDAQDTLQSLGSFLLTQNDATGQERFQMLDSSWKVCAQFPSAGAETSLARMVDLRVVKLNEPCV